MKLTERALNRATLRRQLLLERETGPVASALARIAGMQGQSPNAPYVGLWSRLAGFVPAELAELLLERKAVRGTAMRATVHLLTAADFSAFRPLLQGMLAQRYVGSPFSKQLVGIPEDELVKQGTALLAARAMTRVELGGELARRWPDADPTAMSYALSYLLPLVQATPRGVWGASGAATLTMAQSWLGEELRPSTVDDLVLRYLGAFGPASAADAQAWSGLTRLREVFERLGPRLAKLDGGLFDLPDAPLPDPDLPAPVRFLPEYDNVLFAYADRLRVNPEKRRIPLPPGNGAAMGTLLVDGFYRADWRLSESGVRVEPFTALSTVERDQVVEEGGRLLGFLGREGEVEFAAA